MEVSGCFFQSLFLCTVVNHADSHGRFALPIGFIQLTEQVKLYAMY